MKREGMVLISAAGLALVVAAAHAEVVATARSPEGAFGEFRVVLDAVGEPAAVANFTGLVDGSRPWVDPVDGHVRGGEGDAYYEGMAFNLGSEELIRGGGRRRVGEDGTVVYAGGPGYTVMGKTNEAWSAFGWGALALLEEGGPHSGGGEIAFLLTNSVVGWTVFGQVVPGDEAGLAELAARVVAGQATEVAWSVDASGATEAERAALEAAGAELPVPRGIATRLKDGHTLEFDWPARSRLGIWVGDDLIGGMEYVEGGWNDGEGAMAMSLGWAEAGLEGEKGFVGFTGIRYPAMTGEALAGKWRMGMDHTGQRIQYWFDFDGGTGMWAVVESGKITDSGYLSNILTGRTAGNSVGIYFGIGLTANYYYLGFGEAGARTGRFMSRQLIGSDSLDWGMFEMAEGWGEEGEGKKCTMQNAQCRMRNTECTMGDGGWWVEWKKAGAGDWEKVVRGLGRRDRTW